jgi:hypothetical protein
MNSVATHLLLLAQNSGGIDKHYKLQARFTFLQSFQSKAVVTPRGNPANSREHAELLGRGALRGPQHGASGSVNQSSRQPPSPVVFVVAVPSVPGVDARA